MTPPCQHLSISSRVRYHSGEGALHRSCLLCHGPLVVALQPASPKLLGSQEPLALSRRVPLLVMPLVVCQAETLEATAGRSHLTFRREEYETMKFYKTKN
jgi:hypothetical protein